MSGSLCILITALLWSTAGVFVKYLSWSALSIAAFRGLWGFLILLAAKALGERGKPKKAILPKLTRGNLTIAFFMWATSGLYMLSAKMTTAANAIVLQYIAPVFVLLYAVLFEARKPAKMDIFLTMFIFAGCVLAFAGQLSADGVWGNLLAVLSGVTFAGELISTRKKNADSVDGVILGCAFSFIAFLPSLLSEPRESFNAVSLSVALCMGVFQYGLSYAAYSYGMKRISALKASLIMTLEPVMSPVWVFAVIGERPSALSLIGLACVGGGLILQAVRERGARLL